MSNISTIQGRILFYLIGILLLAIIGLWASLFFFSSSNGDDSGSDTLPVLQKQKQEEVSFSPVFSGEASVTKVNEPDDGNVSTIQAKTTLNFYDTETGIERETTVDSIPIKVSPATEIVSIQKDSQGNITTSSASLEDVAPGSKVVFYTEEDVITSFQGSDRNIEAIYIEILPPGGDPRPQI